ncbi:bifunctional UDP-N-acetylglucosamine diphosphorylase/glucosamine-1-phosphate N-acetyltransferase GlmU [Glaciecola sp. MH2013]|uniref:bifunctional UDP-N-acetylglucosamine diphosphorylase/glucosamine-1-phosphate N-acetyltransferase GlmU n=1 Tax=Glaciecola sp. MH2013 TaxID=2785524 RepID=UPI0018A0C736|nr:bifunctional UDP-N-acetylglucosamine diphosphorylase/glucosamine-1-phosphate N-acetyltransferase GlmU [Glaciecola sp. MH2013]MBF7074289.1 bifunctional UDP-N-acetylglucosamine diphosphorylase/glucosamine-1-phosphate N-acetyltransferase GlmU [Glaciecola sp. MH2013]
MSLSVIILAAGKGTRMKSSLPKVLHPIAGKPMVEHIIDTAKELDCHKINLIYGHGADLLKSALAEHQVNWCLQAEQLGTGHAVQQAVPFIEDNDDVMILVGDAPLISSETLKRLVAAKENADLALLTVHLDDPTGMGRIVREGSDIKAIVEHKDASDEQRQITEINTGMMLMSGSDLKRWLGALSNDNAQGEYYLTDVIEMAASEGKTIRAAHPVWEREVEGVNNRVQLSSLERAFQLRNAEALMTAGVSIADPSRIDVRGELSVGSDVSIDINAVFEGKVNIGNGVAIGPNCVLKNCSIGDNTVIEAYSLIEDAQVAEACNVGPYARLRPGADLKDKAKVGNFCEVKKSVIGEGSKVNHLTYIGDAQIGKGVNVGAGTITCNYDGVNKFTTVIGDGVFVGSNSSLVAPVNLGKNATIGAGSVITKDANADELVIARGKQRGISGWERPKKK